MTDEAIERARRSEFSEPGRTDWAVHVASVVDGVPWSVPSPCQHLATSGGQRRQGPQTAARSSRP